MRLFALSLLIVSSVVAGDWPQLLGPARDGRAGPDEKIADRFPDSGPKVIWKKPVGEGFAGPVVAGGKLILFHRIGSRETVECLESATGKPLWAFDYPTDYRDDFGFDPGPRATPTLEAGRVYTHGAAGMLHCLDMQTGKPVWSVDTVKRFGSRKGFFGRACSPLVVGDKVVLNVGGPSGAGIVAFDKNTGRVAWQLLDDEAGYSSPTVGRINGQAALLSLTREGLAAVEPQEGRLLFHKRFRSSMDASVNAATPLVLDDKIFLSECYGVGGTLWKVSAGGAETVWANDESLSNHYATSVHHEGMLYGFHGRQDQPPRPMLRCVEAATGKVRWSTPPLAAGSLILTDGKLVILTEEGELILAPASPEGFNPAARAQVLGFQCRALPALSNGSFYARDKKQLICLDLRDNPKE